MYSLFSGNISINFAKISETDEVMGPKKHKKHKSERREKYEGKQFCVQCVVVYVTIFGHRSTHQTTNKTKH